MNKANAKLYLYWIALSIFSGIALYLQSVTGLISIVVLFSFGCGRKLMTKTWLLFLLTLPAAFFILNKSSLDGRIHLLNINLSLLAKKFPAATASYSLAYNHEQIQYFRQNGFQSKKAMLADESVYALNDIVQLTIMHGWVGLMTIFIFYAVSGYALVRSSLFPQHSPLQNAVLLLMPFYIFIPFSYPLQIPILSACFILCHLPLLLYLTHSFFPLKISKPLKTAQASAFALFLILFVIEFYQKIKAEDNLDKVMQIWNAGFHKNALDKLTILGNKMEGDKKLVYHKALSQHLSGNNTEALSFLLKYHARACGYDYHILCGDIYKELFLPQQAVAEYENALYLVPHKLESRYKLMQLYRLMEQPDSACYFALQLLATPLKTDNPRADFYKLQAELYVQLPHRK